MNAIRVGSPSLLSVRKLAALSAQRTEAEFLADFPKPVLIIQAVIEGANGDGKETGRFEPVHQYETGAFTTASGKTSPVARGADETARLRHLEAVVTPLAKTPRNSFADMITVGRAPNNDIILPVGSVSKLHAYFTQTPDGQRWRYYDAGATNGSFVRGERLSPRSAVDLADGDEILLGPDVPLIFKTPIGLYSMLKALAR